MAPQAFDVVIEASGSSQGIMLASALTRPMGTIVLKSTCSVINDEKMPKWSDIANDVVVNEKRLQGSRCGHRFCMPGMHARYWCNAPCAQFLGIQNSNILTTVLLVQVRAL